MTQNQIAYYKAKKEVEHWERQDAETQRHNYRTEDISVEGNSITNTHYERSDTENQRHNLAQEALGAAQVDVSRYEADTHRLNLYESVRHNQQTEQLGWSSLSESVRHNKATEDIAEQNVALGYANLGLGYDQLAEAERSHLANESLTNYSNATERIGTLAEIGLKSSQRDLNQQKLLTEQEDTRKTHAEANIATAHAKAAPYTAAFEIVGGFHDTMSKVYKNGTAMLGPLLSAE